MRVCDRHHNKPASSGIVMTATDERLDLCDDCQEQIRAFLGAPTQKTVDPQPKKGLLGRFKDSVT